MGSLSIPFSNPEEEEEETNLAKAKLDQSHFLKLFKCQQNYLNHFFQNLDLSQTLTFTQTLLNARGTIFFTGVGKSGFVAQKISQTLVSLGIKSGFLSPVDALHGDIGILSSKDLLVLFSKSGNTEELLRLVPCAKAKGVYLISVTSAKPNGLMPLCDLNVHLPLERELCPFDLAPPQQLVIWMMISGGRSLNFGEIFLFPSCWIKEFYNQYAFLFHCYELVKDLMKKKEELPVCREHDLIMDQLVELTSKGCGCLLVINDDYHLLGTFTDGDLRRTLKASGEGIFKLTVGEMCNRNPRTIDPDSMAVEAMQKMESPPSPVQFLPVLNDDNVLIGIITLHGLVSAGL
ncbi:Arabinose-5-phosphate isomerase [Handroanthus impetiginosus]|uniref:Arabinose-5-phosphate isomerase n=1 Tax=Handroanthus impetiginosus TaxID=429701 RepID=A0A2G9I713_9LAMI|nr:Arabinose-5-phosphate isomerase [Handroanthus impetiginosus]